MVTAAEHLDQAEHNLAVFRYLDLAAPAYLDWQVTCLFYAALHYSEDARYDLRRLSQQEVHRLFADELTRIRTAIRTALGVPL